MGTWLLTIVVVLVLLMVASTAVAVFAWRRLGGSKLAREARLLVAEETAASGPHQAVVGWRRALGDAVDQTRQSFDAARRAGAPTADLTSLLTGLERAVASLDHELALVSLERDPAIVDQALRTDVGRRADQALRVAGQLRGAVARSVSSGNTEILNELSSSTDLSTRALIAALDELDRRPRA